MTENNDNRNTITYDDDWKSVSYSEYPKVSEELDSDEEDVNSLSAENSDEKKNSPKQLVITIQLVCCILIALAAFLLNFATRKSGWMFLSKAKKNGGSCDSPLISICQLAQN